MVKFLGLGQGLVKACGKEGLGGSGVKGVSRPDQLKWVGLVRLRAAMVNLSQEVLTPGWTQSPSRSG
jgi:hypothetical protein